MVTQRSYVACGLRNLADRIARRVSRAQQVSIEAHASAHASSLHAPSKSKMHRHRAIRMSRNHQRRRNHLAAIHVDLDRIALLRAPSVSIVARLISAALSQLRFVICLGSSCSQPTFA